MVTFPNELFPKLLLLLQDMWSFWPFGGLSKAQEKTSSHSGVGPVDTTLVFLGGPFPSVSLQYALGLPTNCFRFMPHLIVTNRVPSKNCKRSSAFSWKRGGPDWIKYWRIGIASAAATAWTFPNSAVHVDQACLRRKSESKATSWVASGPDFKAATKWGMQFVAWSIALSLGKLLNRAFNAFK